MSFSCPLVFPLFSFWFCSLRFVYIQKEVAKEGENGLMDLLRIKSTTKNEKREKKDRHCGRSYRCSGSSLRHNSSQRVDRSRRKSKSKKKKKNPLLVTLFPIHQFQFSIFSPSLCLFHFLLLLLKGPKNSMSIL